MTRWKISSNDLVIFRGKFSSNLWSINWARYLSVRTTEVHGDSLAPAFCFSKRAPLHKLLLITVYVKVTLLPSRGPLGCVKKGDLTGVRNFPLKANKLTLTRVEQTNADLLRCLMFIAPADLLVTYKLRQEPDKKASFVSRECSVLNWNTGKEIAILFFQGTQSNWRCESILLPVEAKITKLVKLPLCRLLI